MIAKWLPKWVSSRVYLAFGLSSMVVTLLLGAHFLGLVPDSEGIERRHRAALSEAVALAASMALDESQPEVLQSALEFMQKRHVMVRSIALRRSDGTLLAATAGHDAAWAGAPPISPTTAPPASTAADPAQTPGQPDAPLAAESTDTQVRVPVFQGAQRWGTVELALHPLRPPGWQGWLASPQLRLIAFMGSLSLLAFYFYLRRMLRHLDPSRAVPQRVRHALDTLTEGLLVLDSKGRIVLANQSLAAVLGQPADALLARAARDFGWTDRDGARVGAADLPWQRALDQREVQRNGLLYIANAQGERSTFRTNCSPILGPDGSTQGVLASLQDVTELERKEVALQAAKDEADHANQTKSQFLANMSHEIRTPMNAILGFTDVLRRGGLQRPGEAARHLDTIHASGRHLLNLINDILDLSKVEAGRLEVEAIPMAPHTVAQEVLQTLEVRAREKGLQLTLELPQALPGRILGDPARLRQILTNLIGNALKFTEQGRVTLTLRTEGQAYVLDIRDTGIGIAADKLEAVFEPFTQAEASTTRRFGGTGLGLTISRGFARAMGGDITAHSVPGQGTTFRCQLPLVMADSQPWLSPEALRLAADTGTAVVVQRWRFPAARVLVVDDGAENRQLVRIVLEDVGLVVEEAENGQVAVDRVRSEAFDLVLMDMQMPVMDGQTATRTLRAAGCTLPILALTANAMKGFEKALDGIGFDGVLVKPIDIDGLLSELAGRLGGQAVDGAAPSVSDTPQADHGHGHAHAHAPQAAQLQATPLHAASMQATPLHSRLAGHAKLGRLAERFAAQLPDKLTQMARALAAADHSSLGALAHWLKGAGGSMGYDDLFEPARALEAAAHAADARAGQAALDALQHLARRIAAGTSPTPNGASAVEEEAHA